MTFVDEQTRKPRALHIDSRRGRMLCLPDNFRWYVECPIAAGWGSTLDEAWAMWREHRLARQAYKFREQQ